MDAYEVSNGDERQEAAEAVLDTLAGGEEEAGQQQQAEAEAKSAAEDAAPVPAGAPPAHANVNGLDSYLAGSTDFESVTVNDPQLGGNALRSHYTYAVAVQPSRPGVSQVRRRYQHFEWLRNTLVSMFPGLFVPPLPPKQMFGRDIEFVNDRAEELERFMTRVCRHPMFAGTSAFNMFVTRHENTFDAGRKEVDRDVNRQGAIYDTLELYLRAFPNALRRRLPDDAEEGVMRLKTFLEESEATFVSLEKAARQLGEQLSAAASTQAAITRLLGRAAKTEDEYAQRPEPARVDTDGKMRHWTRQRRANHEYSTKHLHKMAVHELEDLRAFLEVIKVRAGLLAHYEKYHAKGEKWRNPDTTVTAKNEATRNQELKTEEDSQRTLEIVTKIILSDQVRRWWENKVATFKGEMSELATRLTLAARADTDVWADLVDPAELDRRQAELEEIQQ